MKDKTEKFDLDALMETLDDMEALNDMPGVAVTVAKDAPSMIVSGNTYPFHDKLKKLSFKYEVDTKQWVKDSVFLSVLVEKLMRERDWKSSKSDNLTSNTWTAITFTDIEKNYKLLNYKPLPQKANVDGKVLKRFELLLRKFMQVNTDNEALEALEMSQHTLREIWDNPEDSIYDEL